MATRKDPAATPGRKTGRRRLHEVSVDLEVPFHDVDALQIVWHGHYFKYFELARTALMRSRMLDNAEIRELGHRLLVIDTGCRHAAPLAYGDQIRVSAWLADIVHRIHVRFEIQNLTQHRRAARGHTILVATNSDGEMLHRTPEAILKRLSER